MKRTKEQFIEEVLIKKYRNFIYDIAADTICICDLAEHSLAIESWLAAQFTLNDLLLNTKEIIRYANECLIIGSDVNGNDDGYVVTLIEDLVHLYKNILHRDENLAVAPHLKWVPLTTFMEQEQNGQLNPETR